jgi:uncharacterized protein GlcG (DUF336 family)
MSTPAGARQVTLEAAEAIIAAARQRARDIGVPMNIAVVDDGANLVAFARMDGAWLGSIDIALGKAFTARAFDLGTDALAPMSQPGQPLYGITATNHGHVVILPGGLPLEADGAIRGAIGVSGGEVGQDQQVAEAGAAAFGEKH